ncbi:hypothetical protein L9F63_015331, partial [Diploptera punctata]
RITHGHYIFWQKCERNFIKCGQNTLSSLWNLPDQDLSDVIPMTKTIFRLVKTYLR